MPRAALLALCLAASTVAVAAPTASSRTSCTPGVTSVGGVQARVFCGPAKAKIHVNGKTLSFGGGDCERTSKYVSVNIGTVVLGQTTKKKPDYFGLDVGQIPGSTNKPFFLTSVTAMWASVSNRLFATFLVISHESARVWTICVCVIMILSFRRMPMS